MLDKKSRQETALTKVKRSRSTDKIRRIPATKTANAITSGIGSMETKNLALATCIQNHLPILSSASPAT